MVHKNNNLNQLVTLSRARNLFIFSRKTSYTFDSRTDVKIIHENFRQQSMLEVVNLCW